MIERFDKRLNRIFNPYKSYDKIVELREEMLGTLMDRYNELKEQGKSDEESYQESLSILDGIQDTIDVLVRENTPQQSKNPVNDYLLPTMAYWLAIVIVFIAVSFGTGAWDKSWMIIVGGALLFGIVVGGVLFKKSLDSGMKLTSRGNMLAIVMLSSTMLYLIWSFATRDWQYTWITFLVGIIAWIVIDMTIVNKKPNSKMKLTSMLVVTVLATVIIYILSSFLTGRWEITWLIFVIMALVMVFELMYSNKK